MKGIGCPKCSTSKAELRIIQLLEDNNIGFEWQYDKCINPKTGYPLPYDFYIPNMNLLLEYDGIFHSQQVYKSHDLHKTQVHDRYKNMWARKNGYNLIRINYKQDLEKELQQILTN